MENTTATPAPRSTWKTLLLGIAVGIFVGAIGLIVVTLVTFLFFQKEASQKMAESKELAPLLLKADFDWSVDDLNGTPVNLSAFTGQPLFLHFWNPSCVSCLAEIPAINGLYESFGSRGIAFAAVAIEADDDLAVDVAANDIRFPVYRGDTKALPEIFATRAAPITYVINRDGFVVLKHVGAIDWSKGDATAFLETLLAE